MKIEIKNWDLTGSGKEVEVLDCIFSSPVNEGVVAQVVRWQMAKSRSGNAATKTRSDVSGTTRKPWAQKETGKARQGSLRSPHFRGGGVVFGPHPRSYEFKVNKKVKELALFSILSDRMNDKAVHVVESFVNDFEKTKDFVLWKEKMKLGKVLFVGDVYSKIARCIANVPYCNILSVEGINVLSCVKHDVIIFDQQSVDFLNNRFGMFVEDGDVIDGIGEKECLQDGVESDFTGDVI